MRNTLLGSLTGLLMPLASYGVASTSYSSYQRNHSQVMQYDTVTLGDNQHLQRISAADVQENELTLQSGAQLTELIIVDAAVPDKRELRKLLRPGVALIELDADRDAVQQIISALEKHHDLRAVHLVSHAEAGALQVGEYHLDRNNLPQQEALWSALNKATRSGADLMLYGCNLAAKNNDVLDIIQEHTHLDVAASDNFTGAENLGGDWNLEIHAGDIQAQSFSANALKDFSDVLAMTVDFQSVPAVSTTSSTTQSGYVFSITHLAHGSYPNAGHMRTGDLSCRQAGAQYALFAGNLDYYGAPADKIYIQKSGGGNFALKNIRVKGVTSQIYNGFGGGFSVTADVKITAYKSGVVVGSPVTQTGISGAFTSIDLSANTDFADVDKVRIQPLKSDGTDSGSICLKTVSFDSLLTAPTVTNANISISGASGAGGAYKIGDTVTATWNNTAGGDNNSGVTGVTVDFSAFGGGSAVVATNSSNTWTATYTITAGAIDAVNRNVSVTATTAGGSGTTADSTNATVDNIAPTLSSITLSGSPASTDSSMAFTASFSESVTNISTDDFTLATTSGTATGTIASVSAASGSSVNININSIAGNGIFKLNLNGSTNIADDVGNSGIAAYSSGSTHTVAIPTVPTAPTIGTATAGDGQVNVTFTAPGNNGGSAITTYTATANPGGAFGSCAGPAACTATVSGLNNGTAYTFTVTATNAVGTSVASGVSNSATPKGNQTITFTNPGTQNFGTTPTLTATADSATGTDNLTVTFSSSTTGVCTITSGGALTFVTAGSCTIDADQAGDSATNAATTATETFTVNAVVPGAPTIGSATAGNTQATVTFTAPASTGGAAILAGGYTVTANPGGATGTGSSSPITVTGLTNGVAYTFTVTATNSVGAGAASAASNSIIPASPQAITFADPGAQTFGTAPNLSTLGAGVSSTSGLTVTFASATTSVCTITSGGILTFISAGACTINADQAGDSSYLPAPQVSHTFTVNPVVSAAPTIGTAIAGDTQASVAFTPPINTGGTSIIGYTVTVSPPDVAPINGASSPIVVTGLTNGQAYTFTVTAQNSAGASPASIASNSITPKSIQTITFANPGPRNFGTTPTLIATTDATGLIPTFTSSTPAVCTVTTGGALTFVSAGTCTINADQAGDATYLAAPQVTNSFTVNAVVPGAPTIGTATAGNAQATVAFTAPVSSGGSPITGYTVTASPGGATAAGAGSPITFTGLTNGTAYTFTVSATNGVGAGSPSAASNAVTPSVPPNNAPVITQGASTNVTMSEDGAPTPFSLSLSATDGDNDTLTWSITSPALNGSASVSGGSVSYTPTANYNGSDSFVVQVSDGDDTDSITVNVTVTPVNDAPVISGTPTTSLEQDVAYSFTPTATDIDTADVLTFSITNKPIWASFNTATGALTGTPANADAGISGGIVISVSDGTATTALAAFEIEVIATIDPLQPIVTAPADLELNATGLFTPVTLNQLVGLSPSATQAEIDAVLKGLASDGVSGNSCCITNPEGLTSNTVLLAPGRHEIKWKATNAVGVSGEAIQVVNMKPLISLSKSQIAIRGSDLSFSVILNGDSPTYPLDVPYIIDTSTTATSAEHNLTSGVASFTQKGQLEVSIPVSLVEVTGLSDSQLVIALGGGLNAGVTNRHTIDIRTGNVPPVVSMSISQGGVSTSLVTPNGGPVSVSVTVTDPNKLDTHTFDWSATSGLADTDGNPADASRTFDPAGLVGGHQVQVTVTDSTGAVVSAQVYLRVVTSLPLLDTNTDTDQDGVSDELEGAGDSDNNGIPNYLDNMPSPNILPQQGNTTNSYLIECDPGVRCGLGLFARGSLSGGVQILESEVGSLDDLIIDPAFEPVGGIFDFTISDLPTPGQSVRVVIPQQAPIPANAVYRKFKNGAWVTFVSDADNALHSAAGNPGYCPPPGTADWTTGLTAGHLCVQLTLEDGGPNDDDGLVNSAVVDPGAVSEAKEVVEPPPPPPPPPKPPVQVSSKGGGTMPAFWLLLLGGLVILKRATPARLAAIALAVFSINTQAVDNTYLRVDVFTVNSSHSEADFSGALEDAGHEFTLSSYDDSRTGFQIAAGYQWSELTYSEIGYLDLGDVEVNLTLDGDTDLDAFASDFAREYPITATGVTLVQGLSFKAGSAVTLSAEAGAFIWNGEVELDNAVFALEEDDGIDPLVGVKVDLALSDAFSLGLSGRRIFFGDQDVDLFSVSGIVRF